jgi:hypothetical protein
MTHSSRAVKERRFVTQVWRRITRRLGCESDPTCKSGRRLIGMREAGGRGATVSAINHRDARGSRLCLANGLGAGRRLSAWRRVQGMGQVWARSSMKRLRNKAPNERPTMGLKSWEEVAVPDLATTQTPFLGLAAGCEDGTQPVRTPLTLAAGCGQAAASGVSASPAPRREEPCRGIATHAIRPNRPQRLA